jgi:AhpD family alkylhydroperoxidase
MNDPKGVFMSQYDLKRFAEEREKLNELVFKYSGLNAKRYLNLDWQVYNEGTLPAKFKELMGLQVSLALRCDDCIQYHLIQCRDAGVTDSELEEALAIVLAAAGSITVPHIRRIWVAWDEMKAGEINE